MAQVEDGFPVMENETAIKIAEDALKEIRPVPFELEKMFSHPRDDLMVVKKKGGYFLKACPTLHLDRASTICAWFFRPFDADEVINKNLTIWANNPTSMYHGKTPAQIKAMWEKTTEEGTEIHNLAESLFKDHPIDFRSLPFGKLVEWAQLVMWERERRLKHPDWFVYRSEWSISSKKYHAGGTMDLVYGFYDSKGNLRLVIVDFKRKQSLPRGSYKNQKGIRKLTKHKPDNKRELYTLQLHIYGAILEEEYDVTVDSTILLLLHENRESFLRIDCPYNPAYGKKALCAWDQAHPAREVIHEEEK